MYMRTEKELEEEEDNAMSPKRAVQFPSEEERDVGTSWSGGSAGSETVVGSSSGAGAETVDSELGSHEVQDWAMRVDDKGA